jgi:ABC-type lipoprotein export system ATPase subunit
MAIDDSPTPAMLCPSCHTLLSGASEACGSCGLPLDWALRIQPFRDALRQHAVHGPLVLHLRAEWAGGAAQYYAQDGEAIGIVIPGHDGEWRCVPDFARRSLDVDRSGRVHRLALPESGKWVEGLKVIARLTVAQPAERVPASICCYLPREIPIPDRAILGSGVFPEPDFYGLPDDTLAARQLLVIRRRSAGGHEEFWAVSLLATPRVLLNRRILLAGKLRPGDLLQAGGFAWVFNAAEGCLIPVRAIPGADLQVIGAGLGARIPEPLQLDFRAGEFTAVIGPSGAGKSTLLRMLLNAPGSRETGRIVLGGLDADASPEDFSRGIGYVDQHDNVLYGDLTSLECVTLAASLRNRRLAAEDVRQLLRQLDLPSRTHGRCIERLSGGERKRVQIAVSLAVRPGVLILDEPASGLDPAREGALLRLLRSLSDQGCTIVMVTHNIGQLHLADRVIEMERGRIARDSLPAAVPPPASTVAGKLRRGSWWTRSARQFRGLHTREWLRLRHQWARRLAIPILVLPLIFAAALAIAVPAGESALLGFLTALCSIWMGASLGLTAIVDERDPLNHERLLFLQWEPWLASKWLLLIAVSTIQSACFALWLIVFHGFFPADPQAVVQEAYRGIFLVGWSAVGLGLLISAAARWTNNRETAHFVLPLVMLGQLVFSVQVAGRGDDPLEIAYGEFHYATCQNESVCPLPVSRWEPWRGGSLCADCYGERLRREGQWWNQLPEPPTDAKRTPAEHADFQTHARSELDKWLKSLPPDRASQPTAADVKLPRRWPILLSYLTLSRYGDILLRPLPLQPETCAECPAVNGGQLTADCQSCFNEQERRSVHQAWHRSAAYTLAWAIVVFPLLTWIVLRGEEWFRSSRFPIRALCFPPHHWSLLSWRSHGTADRNGAVS